MIDTFSKNPGKTTRKKHPRIDHRERFMASFNPIQSISKTQILIVLLISLVSVHEIYGVVVEEAEINNSIGLNSYDQREFDYFALALQWPGTYCRKTRHCCSSNACCRGANSPTEFTIHGLWPDYNDGSWPSCCTSSSFDIKEISPLMDALQKYWPSLSCGSPKTCHGRKGVFWAHEWEKHGTCSSPVVHNEYEYFLTTLNVYFKYNVTKVLNEAGYVPSNSEKYPLGGIITEIQNAFHVTPQIRCTNGAIEELQLCFYKDLTPRDCVLNSNTQDLKKNSCPKYVSLPEMSSSLGLENVEDEFSWLTASL